MVLKYFGSKQTLSETGGRPGLNMRFGQPLDAAYCAVFHPEHCQVGPQLGTGWFAISLDGFFLFVGLC